MKIIFLCNEYPPAIHGGTGSFVKNMAEYLAVQHEIIVIGAYRDVHKDVVYREHGVTIHKIPMKPDNSKWSFIQNRLRFASYVNRIVAQNEIDVVEGFDTNAWFLFIRKNIPLFIRLHNGERYTAKRRGGFVKLMESLSFFRRDTYIAVSDTIRKEFFSFFNLTSNYYSRATSVIYNGILLEKFPEEPSLNYDKNSIVFVGTLKQVKGLDTLIKAFLVLKKTIVGLQLNIIGPDTMEEGGYKQYLINTYEIQDRINDGSIIFHGRMERQQINTQLTNALVCVVPSLFESFGLVTIEAMACFVPVICTRAGASSEIVESGISGFLIDSGNESQLGALVEQLHAGQYDRNAIIQRARKRVEQNFTLQICAAKTLKLYEERV